MLLLLLTQLANLLLFCQSKKQFDISKLYSDLLLFLVEKVTLRGKKKVSLILLSKYKTC